MSTTMKSNNKVENNNCNLDHLRLETKNVCACCLLTFIFAH